MRLRSLLPIVLWCLPAVACAGDLVVSAAASLTDAFQAVGTAYEARHPGTHVVFNFAASDVLLQQIDNGAPVDVFASADEKAMDRAVAATLVDPPTRNDFASNALVLIVPADSRLPIAGPADLRDGAVRRVAFGDPASVPAGRYTRAALERLGLWDVVSAKSVLAENVRQGLDYVSRGEVEAGFVFATDATIAKGRVNVVATVPTPAPIRYPLAVVNGAAHGAEARAFEAFVLSADGAAILRRFGFGPPR